LTTVPPRPQGMQVARDLFLVFNARPGVHQFYVQRNDGRWYQAPVVGYSTPQGNMRLDTAALARFYGRQLPDAISQMARPANVARPLQTTSAGAAQAMAGAPDPCKFFSGQNHHMIPAASMQSNQGLLTAIGFRLDQPANMIRLPANQSQRSDMAQMCGQNRPVHNGSHGNSYTNAVNEQLGRIQRNLNAGSVTPVGARAQVNSLMNQIRDGLSSGRFTSINDPQIAIFIRNIRL
jgi:hypothetical protein